MDNPKIKWFKKQKYLITLLIILIVVTITVFLITHKPPTLIDASLLFLSPCQLRMGISIITMNENSEMNPVYDYCQNINPDDYENYQEDSYEEDEE